MDKNGNGSETRKQKRTRVQKELEDYKISHRLGVLRYRLQIIDSESDIIRNEIRSLEKTLSGEWKYPLLNVAFKAFTYFAQNMKK